MSGQASWCISLGRWGGVQVRVTSFSLLFAALTLFLASENRTPDSDLVAIAAGSLAILFLSVVLHEVGHSLVLVRSGGAVDEIQIGPLGGLVRPLPPKLPWSECITHLAGPAVNLAISLLAAAILLCFVPTEVMGLVNPLLPENLIEGPSAWIVGLKLTCWINWLLYVVNLLPAFPFDGGFALRAALRGAWPNTPPRTTTMVVTLLAKITAAPLLVTAWFHWDQRGDQILPLWFSLVLLAILLYFGARQEESIWSDDEETADQGLPVTIFQKAIQVSNGAVNACSNARASGRSQWRNGAKQSSAANWKSRPKRNVVRTKSSPACTRWV